MWCMCSILSFVVCLVTMVVCIFMRLVFRSCSIMVSVCGTVLRH